MTTIAKDAIQAAGPTSEEKPVVEIIGAEVAPNSFATEDAELEKLEELAAGEKPGEEAGKPAVDPAAKPETQTGKPVEKTGETTAADASKTAEQSAIIALRKKNSELAAANLVLAGQVQAFQGIVKPNNAEAQPEKTVDPLVEIDEAYLAIATEVDAGTLTQKEAEERRREVRQRERELLREEQQTLLAQQAQPTNDLGLQEHADQLLKDFPVLNKLSADDLAPFEALAYKQAAIEGKPIQEGPLGTKELRQRMAALAEEFYDPKAAAAKKSSGTDAKPGDTKPMVLSDTAKQREAKLQLAAGMPPDIGKIGAGATGGEVTEEQASAALQGGNEDAQIKWLEAHPQFVQKVMGRSMRLK